jgi:hypothetical protein
MRTILAAAVTTTLLSITPSPAGAQDASAFGGWFAMMFTPYGGLPALVTPRMAALPADSTVAGTFDVKYGRWQFDDTGERFNNYGVGGRSGRAGFTIGYSTCENCNNGVIMGQVDFEATLISSSLGADAGGSSLVIGVRPSFGFGKPTEDNRATVAANIDAPASFSIRIGERSRIVPFVAPGIGVGHVRGGEDSETGFRTALAAGVGFFPSERFAIHAVWRKVFIEDGPGALGLGLSFRRHKRV